MEFVEYKLSKEVRAGEKAVDKLKCRVADLAVIARQLLHQHLVRELDIRVAASLDCLLFFYFSLIFFVFHSTRRTEYVEAHVR